MSYGRSFQFIAAEYLKQRDDETDGTYHYILNGVKKHQLKQSTHGSLATFKDQQVNRNNLEGTLSLKMLSVQTALHSYTVHSVWSAINQQQFQLKSETYYISFSTEQDKTSDTYCFST